MKVNLGAVPLSNDIIDKANIGLWAFELDEGCAPRMYVNDTMLVLIGLSERVSPEETYHAWYDHIDSEHYNEVAETVEKMTAGIHAEVQYPWHHPNGDIKFVRCGGVRNPAYKKGIRIEGCHQDVTNILHIEKEELIQLTKEKYKLAHDEKLIRQNNMLKQNLEIIGALASEYTSVYYINLESDSLTPYAMNEETESTFGSVICKGIKYSDAYKLYVDKLILDEDKEMMLKAGSVKNIIKELENKKTFITRYRSVDNKYSEMKFVKVGGDNAEPRIVALGFADKNNVIRKEIERKTIQERNMSVIAGLSDDFGCVIYFNVDTYEEFHYRFDQTFENNIPGWSKINKINERLNTLVKTVMHPNDKKAFLQAIDENVIKESIKNGEPYYVAFRTLINGETSYYKVKFVRDVNSDNNIIVGIQNVDAETKKERETLEKAEAANRAKTTFLNSMSHDIRTPMNAIIGFTDMAEKNIGNNEKVLDCLKKVKISGTHLLKLINDVLDMAHVESGRIVIKEESLDIIQAVHESFVIMKEEAEKKGLDFVFDTKNIKNRYVLSDKLHMNQILLNILSNAIKYTQNGSVKITVTQDESKIEDCGSYDIIVEDTGIGMSEEFADNIFESFARAETATKSGIQGTGLGMSITKSLIDNMGGTIHIESSPGVGTKVIIHFELKISSEIEKTETAGSELIDKKLFKGKRILLVEDNQLNREIAQEILEENGFVIETAEDGSKAIEVLENSSNKRFDAILMDIQMPVMDGYEATKKIRMMSDGYFKEIPIIAMTANAFEEDRKKALDSGMNEHVAKPIDVYKLMDILKYFIC